jgi:putative glutamine amidotransferase
LTRRPLIGISADLEGRRVRLDLAYVEAVARAGGVPLLVPPLDDPALVLELSGRLDGLLLSGGDGLPARLEGPPGRLPPDLPPVAPERLGAELALLRGVRRAGKPVLGVCLGMQLINLEAGGTLSMDVARDRPGASGHSPKRDGGRHALRLVPGSTLERWCREEPPPDGLVVQSSHLQAVESLGAGLVVVARAEDGVVEAFEPAAGLAETWLLGVQWHPERQAGALGLGLIGRFVEAARTRGVGQDRA